MLNKKLSFLLLFVVSCSESSNWRNQRKRRDNDVNTQPQSCDKASPMTLQENISEGTMLQDMNSYVYFGTPTNFNVTGYTFNGKTLEVGNSEGFGCTQQVFSDERRFFCLEANGELKVRQGSDFRNIGSGVKIIIVISPFSRENIKLAVCTFTYYIGFRPTFSPPATTTVPSTTTKATTNATTIATMSTTTTHESAPSKTTVKTTTRAFTLHSEKETEGAKTPNEFIATPPTTDPCLDEKTLKQRLDQCIPTPDDFPAIPTNQSFQSVFEFKIDSPTATPIFKTASIKVGSYADHLEPNSSFSAIAFFGSGKSKSFFKNVTATLMGEQTVVGVDEFIPTGTSRITVELYKGNRPVMLPWDLVRLIVNNYGFCSNETCLHLYSKYKTYGKRMKCADIIKETQVSRFHSCFVCPSEVTPSTNGSYLWPRTSPNSIVTLACKTGVGNVSRMCHKSGIHIPRWGPVNLKKCKVVREKRSEALANLANVVIDASNASKASEKLKNLTQSDPMTIPPSQLNDITSILEELSTFATNQKVANDMLDTVDNCMKASSQSLLEGQRANNVSKRMVTILSKLGGAILANRTEFAIAKKGFALAGTKEHKASFQGVAISYKTSVGLNSSSIISLKRGSIKDPDDSSASIQLPRALLTSQGNDHNDIIFVAYDQGKLFQEKGRSRLNSKVISAEVKGMKISGLEEPVVTQFKAKNDSKDSEQICAWWDFDLYGGTGGWSSIGCVLSKEKSNGYVECHCNHLTNFAVLLGAKIPEKSTAHQVVLKFISYVGIGISLAGTLFTLISYIIFPKLRDNAPPKILMNLCAALIFLQAIFLIGIERTSPRQGCQAVAFLLQYVLLCVLAWSGVEGFFSYRGIVMPMKSEVQNLMYKAAMFGWVVPILFPILGISFWSHEYGDNRSCAVKGMPLFITVIAPVVLVMLLNLFSIVSIMVALHRSSKMYPHNAINAYHRLRIVAAFILLFGLTWFFGFLVIANDIIAFQYIFCVFNSLQGFFLFIFYGVRNENVRKSWLDKFYSYRERRAFSTSAGTKRTESSFDSATYNKSDSLRSNSLRKSKEMDSKGVQFQVHMPARANLYEAPPMV